MNFLEKDLENIIWESDNKKLQEKKLPIYGIKFRQLRIGNYGISDLITIRRDYYYDSITKKFKPYIDITVYELKKEKVGISAFLQAIRYCKGIKTYVEDKYPDIYFKLNIVLCAKYVDLDSDFIYITDLLNTESTIPNCLINSIRFFSFDYNIDGITFEKHSGYSLINTGF